MSPARYGTVQLLRKVRSAKYRYCIKVIDFASTLNYPSRLFLKIVNNMPHTNKMHQTTGFRKILKKEQPKRRHVGTRDI
jgi:hypothetical protein